MNLSHAEYTSQGLVRDNNEDTCLSCIGADSALFLVADGIGGRSHGEVASGMLRNGFYSWWKQFETQVPRPDFRDVSEEIRSCLLQINQGIIAQMGSTSTGSTLVLLFLYQGKMLTVSSGDSRIYRARGLFSWNQITVDDVYENCVERDSFYDPSKEGQLTGAIGIRREPVFAMHSEPVKTGDRFLLCSDGVYRFHSPGALRYRVSSLVENPVRIVAAISREVEKRGAGDNYTLIYVRVNAR